MLDDKELWTALTWELQCAGEEVAATSVSAFHRVLVMGCSSFGTAKMEGWIGSKAGSR